MSIPLFENKLHKLMATAQEPTSSQHQVSQNLFKDLNLELTRMVQRQSGGEMTLQLRPGDMGHVKVDVAVTGDSIRIEMVAEKSASESLIKSQLGELKTQLTQAGFKIDELAVMSQKSSQSQSGFDGSNSGREHQQHSHQQNRKQDPDAIFSSDLKFEEQVLGAA
jgi:flagellar hook-length control protein FliK